MSTTARMIRMIRTKISESYFRGDFIPFSRSKVRRSGAQGLKRPIKRFRSQLGARIVLCLALQHVTLADGGGS